MNQSILARAIVVILAAGPSLAHASAFLPGDLVVYQVGDGTSALSSSTSSVFLDEYTSSGMLVQSIAMPTATVGSNGALTASGTATSEGELTLSPNGQYLAFTGYDAAVGTASISGTTSTAVNRTVGIVGATGVVNTSTLLTDASSGNNIRSAVTTDGNTIYVAGAAGGVRATTLGSTTSTQLSTTVTNIRQVNVFNNQLFVSDSSGSSVRVGTVGTGLPTTAGQAITNLPGFPATTGSPYSYFFASLKSGSANFDGFDTLYVADDGAGITKYTYNGSSFVADGTVGASTNTYRGLTGTVTSSGVLLYAIGSGGSTATGGGQLVSLLDSSGYGGTLSASVTTLATAGNDEAFRGVAFAPTAPVPLPASAWLLLSAVGGLGAAVRRRTR